ncbi:interleukin 15, like isoform X1 [Pelmatolapia mariae]|uniref:interleukin 15, like isoform X1 n=1 Tax=Pelmatolapia mariae TaxID=158779 RepID=UPI002FE60920
MQRERPALVSVFVFLCSVNIIAITQKPCSRDLYVQIESLKEKVSNISKKLQLNCSLYTPTMEDYEQICPRTMMQCFASEMIVLVNEWELEPKWKKLNILLNRLASRINQTASKCRRCEVMKEENATTFLENLLWTVEKTNSDYC